MAKREPINQELLLGMLRSGKALSEIKLQFGFKNTTQVKIAILKAYEDEGLIPPLRTSRQPRARAVKSVLRVGKRGSLILPKELVESFGFKEGDCFSVRRSKYGVQLRRVDDAETDA